MFLMLMVIYKSHSLVPSFVEILEDHSTFRPSLTNHACRGRKERDDNKVIWSMCEHMCTTAALAQCGWFR